MAKKITFSETGIDEMEERIRIAEGMSFSITAIQMKRSANYGIFPVFDIIDLEGKEGKLYSTSGVLRQQAEEILARYGRPDSPDGILTAEILVTVVGKTSASGRKFLSFA